uniref:hypothetical protein n=1 Tax=Agrobacterium tumefaciens TaxID=358 RepID=UPI0015E8499F|nr:hypothetical protein [Agrobacterium tumefaciens]
MSRKCSKQRIRQVTIHSAEIQKSLSGNYVTKQKITCSAGKPLGRIDRIIVGTLS